MGNQGSGSASSSGSGSNSGASSGAYASPSPAFQSTAPLVGKLSGHQDASPQLQSLLKSSETLNKLVNNLSDFLKSDSIYEQKSYQLLNQTIKEILKFPEGKELLGLLKDALKTLPETYNLKLLSSIIDLHIAPNKQGLGRAVPLRSETQIVEQSRDQRTVDLKNESFRSCKIVQYARGAREKQRKEKPRKNKKEKFEFIDSRKNKLFERLGKMLDKRLTINNKLTTLYDKKLSLLERQNPGQKIFRVSNEIDDLVKKRVDLDRRIQACQIELSAA